MGSFLGVVSGRYIFEEPVKEYWEKEVQGGTKSLQSTVSNKESNGPKAAP